MSDVSLGRFTDLFWIGARNKHNNISNFFWARHTTQRNILKQSGFAVNKTAAMAGFVRRLTSHRLTNLKLSFPHN